MVYWNRPRPVINGSRVRAYVSISVFLVFKYVVNRERVGEEEGEERRILTPTPFIN